MPEGQARRVWMRVSCESGAVSSCPGWEGINLWDFLSLCWSPLQGSRDDFLKCVAWRGIPLPGCEMTVCPNLSHKSDLCSIFPVHQTQIFSGYWTVYSALVLGVLVKAQPVFGFRAAHTPHPPSSLSPNPGLCLLPAQLWTTQAGLSWGNLSLEYVWALGWGWQSGGVNTVPCLSSGQETIWKNRKHSFGDWEQSFLSDFLWVWLFERIVFH